MNQQTNLSKIGFEAFYKCPFNIEKGGDAYVLSYKVERLKRYKNGILKEKRRN